MGRMLCTATNAKGMAHWQLQVSRTTERSAHWEAHYLFPPAGVC